MDTFKWIAGFVIATILLTALIFSAAYQIDKYSCTKLHENTGIETKYSFFGGSCLVKVNDRFIPQENWRGEYQQ